MNGVLLCSTCFSINAKPVSNVAEMSVWLNDGEHPFVKFEYVRADRCNCTKHCYWPNPMQVGLILINAKKF